MHISRCQAISCIADMKNGQTHTISAQSHDGSMANSDCHPFKDAHISTQARRFIRNNVRNEGEVSILDIIDDKSIRYNANETIIKRNVCRQASGPLGEQVTPSHTQLALTPPLYHSGVPFTRSHVHGREGAEVDSKKQKMSDDYLLSKALSTCRHFIHNLTENELGKRQLKVTHGLHEKRECGVMSAIVIRSDDDGSIDLRLGVLWQIMSRPQKAVCITFSLSPSREVLSFCTCDVLISAMGVSKERCLHVQACYQHTTLLEQITNILRNNRREYFGECIRYTDTDNFPAVELQRRGSAPVKTRTGKWMQNWSFWVVYDTGRGLFVPVLKIKLKRFECQLCRGASNRTGNCAHEASCKFNCDTPHSGDKFEEDGAMSSDNSFSSESSNECDGFIESPSADEPDYERYMATSTQRTLLMC